jgi:hypothetical protein
MARRTTAAVLLALGFVVVPTAARADEAAAVQEIKKAGGTVQFESKRRGSRGGVIGVNLDRAKFPDGGIKELKDLPKLQWLTLKNFTNAGLRQL